MKPRLIDQPGRARTALIVPVGLFGGLMVALAIVSGNGRLLVERLPLPEPGMNGWPIFVLAVVGAGAWWRMRGADTPLFDECPPERPPVEWDERPLEWEECSLDDAGVGPWFGTAAATPPGSDVPRRGRHRAPVGFDPDLARARLLADDDPARTAW